MSTASGMMHWPSSSLPPTYTGGSADLVAAVNAMSRGPDAGNSTAHDTTTKFDLTALFSNSNTEVLSPAELAEKKADQDLVDQMAKKLNINDA
jgi:hypothetical protein